MTQVGTVKLLTTPMVTVRATSRADAPSITITTSGRDRENDRMMIDKLVVPDALPVLFSHEHRELPVGRTVAIARTPTSLRATFQWLENDARAAAVRNAFEQDMLSASVGVRVTDAVPNEFDGFDLGGELVEWSLVGVPANPECTRLLKSLGLASDAARGDETVLILRDGPTGNENTPGKNPCPGPAGGDGCEWRHPQAVEACAAARRGECPINGQNRRSSFSGVIIRDATVDYSKRSLEETVVAILRDVIVEEVAKSARRAVMLTTGKID